MTKMTKMITFGGAGMGGLGLGIRDQGAESHDKNDKNDKNDNFWDSSGAPPEISVQGTPQPPQISQPPP